MTDPKHKQILGQYASKFTNEWNSYLEDKPLNYEAFKMQFNITKVIVSSKKFIDEPFHVKNAAVMKRINAKNNSEELLRALMYIFDNHDKMNLEITPEKKEKIRETILFDCNKSEDKLGLPYGTVIAESVSYVLSAMIISIVESGVQIDI